MFEAFDIRRFHLPEYWNVFVSCVCMEEENSVNIFELLDGVKICSLCRFQSLELGSKCFGKIWCGINHFAEVVLEELDIIELVSFLLLDFGMCIIINLVDLLDGSLVIPL